ncbi:MAG: 3-oxoacyl-ACP reductase FabG [Planctomycetes bacterium]|nr:3-oxoacyl-ACP reductase FabG [Planctomycetota bacterium]
MGLALVVGGSRGIGRAIAVDLARAGYDIWLTYHRNCEAAEAAQAEVERLGRKCKITAVDAAHHEETKAALADAADKNPPDVVVFNAGITRDNLMVWMTREEWDAVLTTNLDGFFNVITAVLFPMLREKRGRIIVISSTSGQAGQPGQVNYSASKAGLIGAAKALAREVGPRNILVNVVAPGVIETDMTSELPRDQIVGMIPLRRFGRVEEVAAVVRFLCSDECTYIHGQVIGVNGGLLT